ncbi:MAG: hypothetical protein ACI4IF_02175 [Acutalibacteraceae bacterium]
MIGIKVEKAHGEYDPGTSKFFGAPTMPEEWLENGIVKDDDFFFAQLKLSEFAKYDNDGVLPVKKGYIYFFLSENDGTYIPNIQYCETEPDVLIDDFNAGFDFLGDTDAEYSIDFEETENAEDGTKILVKDGNRLTLLQYDPLDDNMPEFLSETECIAYFTMELSDFKNLDFSNVQFDVS